MSSINLNYSNYDYNKLFESFKIEDVLEGEKVRTQAEIDESNEKYLNDSLNENYIINNNNNNSNFDLSQPINNRDHNPSVKVTDETSYHAQLSPIEGTINAITLQGKKLVYATNYADKEEFFLVGSTEINFSMFNSRFLNITETDTTGKHRYYIDVNNIVKNCFLVFKTLPLGITHEFAVLKLNDFKKSHPKIDLVFSAYNRHGIGVVGFQKSKLEFFWLSSQQSSIENNMTKMKDAEFSISDDVHISAENHLVHFAYSLDTNQGGINGEEATPLFYKEKSLRSKPIGKV